MRVEEREELRRCGVAWPDERDFSPPPFVDNCSKLSLEQRLPPTRLVPRRKLPERVRTISVNPIMICYRCSTAIFSGQSIDHVAQHYFNVNMHMIHWKTFRMVELCDPYSSYVIVSTNLILKSMQNYKCSVHLRKKIAMSIKHRLLNFVFVYPIDKNTWPIFPYRVSNFWFQFKLLSMSNVIQSLIYYCGSVVLMSRSMQKELNRKASTSDLTL